MREERPCSGPLSGNAVEWLAAARCSNLRRDAHNDLANMLASQQSDKSCGRVLESFDHVLALFYFSGRDPFAHLASESFVARAIVIEDDKILHANALLEHGRHHVGQAVRP